MPCSKSICLCSDWLVAVYFCQSHAQPDYRWTLGDVILKPGKAGTADETAVKDPWPNDRVFCCIHYAGLA